jgi:hypothetical protein
MFNEKQFRAIYDEYLSSGLTIRDFCINHQMNEAKFYYWQHKLKGQLPAKLGFVPIVFENGQPVSRQLAPLKKKDSFPATLFANVHASHHMGKHMNYGTVVPVNTMLPIQGFDNGLSKVHELRGLPANKIVVVPAVVVPVPESFSGRDRSATQLLEGSPVNPAGRSGHLLHIKQNVRPHDAVRLPEPAPADQRLAVGAQFMQVELRPVEPCFLLIHRHGFQ